MNKSINAVSQGKIFINIKSICLRMAENATVPKFIFTSPALAPLIGRSEIQIFGAGGGVRDADANDDFTIIGENRDGLICSLFFHSFRPIRFFMI